MLLRLARILLFVGSALACVPTRHMPMPSMQRCLAGLITVSPGVEGQQRLRRAAAAAALKKLFKSDVINDDVRTFTCEGANAYIEVNGDGGTIPAKDGVAMLKCYCNAAGTAWEVDGVPITKVECSEGDPPACGVCNPGAIDVKETGVAGAKHMDDATAGCERTFTCMGMNARIRVNGAMVVQQGGNTAVFTVRCNMAGSAWESIDMPGMVVNEVMCIEDAPPACDRACDPALIMKVENTAISKPMDNDVAAGCDRTFTCMGLNGANAMIEVNGAGPAPSNDPPGNVIMFTVTCSLDATQWEYMGNAVTSVDCQSAQTCGTCAKNLITVLTIGPPGAKAMQSDTTAGCVRTFTCMGKNAKITVNGVTDEKQGGDMATLAVECNVGGTAWLYMNAPVNNVVCVEDPPACRCAANLIDVVKVGTEPGSKPFDSDLFAADCSTRTFTCNGPTRATIWVNGVGPIEGTPNAATFTVTCNAAGTAWEFANMAVTKLECTGR